MIKIPATPAGLGAVEELADRRYAPTDPLAPAFRVIADHLRAATFLMTDGVVPSNEGRGYVLRRIIRRAIRHGHKLGMKDPFFYRLVQPLETEMGGAYPELGERRELIERVLAQFAALSTVVIRRLPGAVVAI